MSKVKVVVDSTADIPHNLAEDLEITVLPLVVHFGDDTYLDWVELTSLEFYDLLETSPDHPQTSQPSPGDFAEVYERLVADGSPVVSLHLSAEMSGTFQAAQMGRDMVGAATIEVVDTRLVSIGFGLPAIAAAKAAQEGRGLDEVVALVKDLISRTSVFFAVDTLDYLVRNGRIGKAQAVLGTLFAVKPVLTISDGLVAPCEKVRGQKKVIPRMVGIMGETLGSAKAVAWGVAHANCLDKAMTLRGAIEEAFGLKEGLLCDLGAVVGTHSGPGAVGVAFIKE